MAFACKICILTEGLTGNNTDSLPETEEDFFDHIEKVHHIPVKKEGETHEQAIKRFLAKYPEVINCPHCKALGTPWTTNKK